MPHDTPLSPRRQLSNVNWTLLGKKVPRGEIVYLCQVLVLFTVILTSIYNLTAGAGANSNLWTSLLCSCLGYLLPNPTLHHQKEDPRRSVNATPNSSTEGLHRPPTWLTPPARETSST